MPSAICEQCIPRHESLQSALRMILYSLICDNKHSFESWFANSAAYDKQVARGLVSCPACNSIKVEKAIMAPSLARAKKRGAAPAAEPKPDAAPAEAPA